MRKKFPKTVMAYAVFSMMIVSAYAGYSIHKINYPMILGQMTENTPLTEKNLCDASPKCQWSGVKCECAANASPIPVRTYRWVEVKDPNGEIREEDYIIPQDVLNLKNKIDPAQDVPPQPILQITEPIPDVDTVLKSPTEKRKITVKKAIKTEYNGSSKITLSGVAIANTNVYLYVFSETVEVAIKAQADGSWSYTLERQLEPGVHKAYGAIINESGQLVRSTPFEFTISKSIDPTTPQSFDVSYKVEEQNNAKYIDQAIKIGLAIAVIGIVIKITILARKNKEQ